LVEEAIGHQLAAFQVNNKDERYRGGLYNQYKILAECLVELGEHRGAAKAVADLSRLYPRDGQARYASARLLASCTSLAGNDAKLPTIERGVLVFAYANQAMEQLLEGSRLGQLRAEDLRKDVVFETLRSRKDFQQLLSELDQQW
jgi:hypothetical protein